MNTYEINRKAACKLAAVAHYALTIEEQIKFVLNMVGYNCQGQLLDHIQIKNNVPNRAQRDRELFTKLEEQVRTASRGAFIVVERQFFNPHNGESSHSTYQTIVSDGSGQIANGGRFNSYSETPSIEAILIAMVKHEISDMLQLVKKEQMVIASQQCIREHGLKVGQSFSNIDLPGHLFPFAKVQLIKIDLATGMLSLGMTRKGRTTVEHETLPASYFALYAKLISTAKQPPVNQDLPLAFHA